MVLVFHERTVDENLLNPDRPKLLNEYLQAFDPFESPWSTRRYATVPCTDAARCL
jgi:hypothetical protein